MEPVLNPTDCDAVIEASYRQKQMILGHNDQSELLFRGKRKIQY